MAARQDQTLQILSICLVGLVVILGGCLIWVNRLKADYRQQAEAAEEAKAQADSALRSIQTENQQYRTKMGFGEFDQHSEVMAQIEEDLANYGSSFEESQRKYRILLSQLAAELQNSAEQESQAKERLAEAEEQRQSELAAKNAEIAKHKEALDQLNQQFAQTKAEFEQDRAQLEQQRQQLTETLARVQSTHRSEVQSLSEQITQKDTTVQEQQAAIDRLLEGRKQEDFSFEVADGRIAWVNQGNQTVWVNLGEADALQRQITFSVYEQGLPDAGKAEKKGSIEVVQILDDHLAEAKITSDDPRNPIMPGDHIYSQVWQRGKRIHFALAGQIDVNDDGQTDMQLARDLISMNGGVVDAYVNDQGEVSGELTVETRYLVLGEYPSSPSSTATNKREAWERLSEDAQRLGVQTITLQEFLNQMGYRPMDRTVALDEGARPEDFRPNPQRGSGFRTRSPYKSPPTAQR